MPEGPEVRRNAEQLNHLVKGKKVKLSPITGKLYREDAARSIVGEPTISDLPAMTVHDVRAYGKLIYLELDQGGATSTLGMSGWWYPPLERANELFSQAYQNGKLVDAASVIGKALKHTRLMLIGESGEQLAAYTDPRNFGNFEYLPNGLTSELRAAKIGVDLLNEVPMMSSDEATRLLVRLKREAPKRLQRMRLCDLALEQSFIAGLGNIYRAEAIWLSGLSPFVTLHELTEHEWLMFCEIASTVLQISYATGGVMQYPAKLLEECLDITMKKPEVIGHLVYGRTVDFLGRPVLRDTTGGRTLWHI